MREFVIWLGAILSVIMSAQTQDICSVCSCRSLQQDILCLDKNWLHLASRLVPLPNTTLYFTVLRIPLIELLKPADDYEGVPSGQLNDLVFIDTELRVIPNNYFKNPFFSNISFLQFENSLMEDLADVLAKVSQAPQLMELVLVNNPFPEIKREMFLVNKLNERLEGLNIGKNPFKIPDDLLDDFAGHLLSQLSLNGLTVNPDAAFLRRLLSPLMSQLELLDLSNVGLKEVPDFLNQFDMLIELKLSDNAIISLEVGFEDVLRCQLFADSYLNTTRKPFNTGLRTLYLERNQLEVLDPRSLPDSLQSLDVSFNRISDIKYGFTLLRSLQTLELGSNKIKSILPDLSNPTDNPNLMYINFRRNRLGTITEGWLLNYVNALAVSGTSYTLVMTVAENPYSCHCGMVPILNHILNGSLEMFTGDAAEIICYMPDKTPRNVYTELMTGPPNTTDDLVNYNNCMADVICDSSTVNRLNCSNKNLATIPRSFPGTPWHVDLSNNNLRDLIPSYLDMDKGAAGIITLDLSYNVIGPTLSVEDVGGLLQLEEIDMSHNRIEYIGIHVFLNNTKLRKIDLSYNYLSNICHVPGNGSLWYPLALPSTKLYLSNNQIRGLPCNAFSLNLEGDSPLPFSIPTNITWDSIDLSYNCIDMAVDNGSDFYQLPGGLYSGFGVINVVRKLDFSHNFIDDFTFLMSTELLNLKCAGELNVEYNRISFIENVVILNALQAKWDECGSSMLLGKNPYDCRCKAIDFWIYYNQSVPEDLEYINSTSMMECAQPDQYAGQILHDLDYPSCACENGSNPCFVYGPNPTYFAECIEVLYSDPPQAECGACPRGFSGDGFTCTVVDPCVDSPCFIHPDDPTLFSVCTQTLAATDGYICGPCPTGTLGNGVGPQGCQDIDNCQIYSCYSDAHITLNCTDDPPPSLLITCDPCPPGLDAFIDGVNCMVEGQCCVDDNPCASPTSNYCFLNDTCTNKVWPETGLTCGACPSGTKDVDSPSSGRYCAEIDGCLSESCYNETSPPAMCTDVLWHMLEKGDDPSLVICVCAAGTTGVGHGVFGCHDIDGCMLDPCWEDLTGLGVEAICTDIPAYPGMQDEFEVTCMCPTGTTGDGFNICSDTNPCWNATNPCFVLNSCSVITPPLDAVTCGPCPSGFTGDGRVCADIDECAEATAAPACYEALVCVPTPQPHTEGQYSCIGECPCGMVKQNGGRGPNGCAEINLCNPNPCSTESTCQFNVSASPVATCGACSPGQLPIPGCGNDGTKSCCLSTKQFSFRMNAMGVSSSLNPDVNDTKAGLLQIYYNGVWGDVVYPSIVDKNEKLWLLTYTADAVCRELGFPAGNTISSNQVVRSAINDPHLSLVCRKAGLNVMDCDWSGFYGTEANCSAPANRHYIACGYGLTGYQLIGSSLPNDGEVYTYYYPTPGTCPSVLLPVCFEKNLEELKTAMRVCLNQGFPGPYKQISAEFTPTLISTPEYDNVCVRIKDGKPLLLGNPPILKIVCHVDGVEYRFSSGFLQMKIGDYSINGDGFRWGYLPVEEYINLSPGFHTNREWDSICKFLGYDHMISIDAAAPTGISSTDCRSWNFWRNRGHQLEENCVGQAMVRLSCGDSPFEVRIMNKLNQPSLYGRVEIRSGGVWSTLTATDHTDIDYSLASAICRSTGYRGAVWWLEDPRKTLSEIEAEYGISRMKVKLLDGYNFNCELGVYNLLGCDNTWPERKDSGGLIEAIYGRWSGPTTVAGYTVVVRCSEDNTFVELTNGHYGEVVSYRGRLFEGFCVNFNPVCTNDIVGSGTVPNSRLPTTICNRLGYAAGSAIPVNNDFDIELPNIVVGKECTSGDCDRYLRTCNLTAGDHLLAVRCYDGYDACAPDTNVCFWKESCIDLPIGTHRLCACPPGYEGDGYHCEDIDECTKYNPCFDPLSCVSIPAPITLGDMHTATPNCSVCPPGTDDANTETPGIFCLEKNGCIPNECSDPDECSDVLYYKNDTAGYTCGACSMGYVPSADVGCLNGGKVAGSRSCCINGDACAEQPCGPKSLCFDLPPPAPVVGGYTCSQCPSGTVLDSVNKKCQDIDSCDAALTPCDVNSFCDDLPPPSLTARCQCHAGYLQNTTGVKGKCPEVNICLSHSDVCGIGRDCIDWQPPADPSLFNTHAVTCSRCPLGYKGDNISAFTFTLSEYEMAIQINGSIGIDCTEYDACIELPLQGIQPCYKFPGNAAYDVQCIDTPASEYRSDAVEFRCGTCPPGQTGTGYGEDGCANIDSCASSPCDSIAVECVDLMTPLDGFSCICPTGSLGCGPGNRECVDYDSCRNGDNSCMFPHLCADLPYTDLFKHYICSCPRGMELVSERACGDIDGCTTVSRPCYGRCEDVPYTDALIVLAPKSDGKDFKCKPCPFGMAGNAVGKDGCKEIDLCKSSPLTGSLCYASTLLALYAECEDVPYTELQPSDPKDLYRCHCPEGMTGLGYGQLGCTNIDACETISCGNNTICLDMAPPSTDYICICSAGYAIDPITKLCIDADHCAMLTSPCDYRMTCLDLPPPMDVHSSYYSVVHCSSCPVGTSGEMQVVYIVNGATINPATCAEIDGCQYNDTCWVNPITRESLCRDVPSSKLQSWNTGYEIRCSQCPHGLRGNGDTSYGQIGCADIDGCELNRCFVGVACVDIPWYSLSSTQRADDYICGECPGELKGDGRTCLGGCTFDTDLCGGELTGAVAWYRDVGLLDNRTAGNINQDSRLGEAPLYDHTQPLSTKGYYLTIDTDLVPEDNTSTYQLPVVRGPASVHVLFYAYYNGPSDGVLYVKQRFMDGGSKTLWLLNEGKTGKWIGERNIYALSNKDFIISFEYYRIKMAALSAMPSSTATRLYVAFDDLFLNEQNDWQCSHNQICYKAELCMKYPKGYDSSQSYICYCLPGYTGQYCERKLDACSSNPCHGTAKCTSDLGQYACLCPASHTGDLCELDVDECATNTAVCVHGATCTNLEGDFRCDCLSGFSGKNCETNIDDCNTVDCGSGQCVDLINDYVCICRDGWEGSFCQINQEQCSASPCQHGSKCSDNNGPFQCHCMPGYSGRVCENNIDSCAGVTCHQAAVCIDLVNGYRCDCPPGYDGKLCERDIGECENNPCKNKGRCFEGIDDSRCLCKVPGCRDFLDCSYKSAKYLCECLAGYTGDHCETKIDQCANSPCVHGKCVGHNRKGVACQCYRGWTGSNCKTEMDECQSKPCLNMGTCFDLVDDFACRCRPGFSNKDCSGNINECSLHRCQNGAKCKDLVFGYECICTDNHAGEFCQLKVDFVSKDVTTEKPISEEKSTLVIPKETPNSEAPGERSKPKSYYDPYTKNQVIVASQTMSDPDGCSTWADIGSPLRVEIVGYGLLAVIISILLLLACSLCRIKSNRGDGYSSIVSPVTRYVPNFPYYGGHLYQPSPRYLTPGRGVDSDSGTHRSRSPSREARRRRRHRSQTKPKSSPNF